jgi:hypothetical protein
MTRAIRRALVVLALFLGAPGAIHAGQIEELARQAEAKAEAGQYGEAMDILRRAIDSVMARAPLSLRRVQFIAEPPKGFGIYQPRGNNVFRAGEPLIIYAEPIGVGWKMEGGLNRSLILVDFELRKPDGKILGGQKEFGRFEFTSREQNHEIMTHLTIRISGAPNGSYVIAATYRDQVADKSANLELPFEIR